MKAKVGDGLATIGMQEEDLHVRIVEEAKMIDFKVCHFAQH